MNEYGRRNMVTNINTKYAKRQRMKNTIAKLIEKACKATIGIAVVYMIYVACINDIGSITFTQCMVRMMLAIGIMILAAFVHDNI